MCIATHYSTWYLAPGTRYKVPVVVVSTGSIFSSSVDAILKAKTILEKIE